MFLIYKLLHLVVNQYQKQYKLDGPDFRPKAQATQHSMLTIVSILDCVLRMELQRLVSTKLAGKYFSSMKK